MYLEKRGFVIFLQGPTFWDFIDSRLLNYIPSGIRICFPLFWGIFFPLGSNLIKKCRGKSLLQVTFMMLDKIAAKSHYGHYIEESHYLEGHFFDVLLDF